MQQEVVQTKLTDSKNVADELCRQLHNNPEHYNCVIFFASTSVNYQELQAELSARFTNAQIIGTTTSGEITPKGFTTSTVVLNAIADSNTQFSAVLVDDVDVTLSGSLGKSACLFDVVFVFLPIFKCNGIRRVHVSTNSYSMIVLGDN